MAVARGRVYAEMHLDFRNGKPLAPPRTPEVIPSGRFEGRHIAEMETADLRALQIDLFRRAPALQRAITRELTRRHRGRRRRRAA